MTIVRTAGELRRRLAGLPAGTTIGLVPTLGALHAGHAACFKTAREATGHVVGTIFVNPTQFTDPADLAAYPRTEDTDARLAGAAGVDTLFIPAAAEMYPGGDTTWVDPAGAALGFEGDFRPGHFRGVATICTKLFALVRPQVACFGQKDAQQVAVIRQVIRDLLLGLDVAVVPTVRDPDGLALSSRNSRLSPDERRRALALPRALAAGLAAHAAGADPSGAARACLDGLAVDYADVAHFDGEPTLVIAARVGATRLIDNVPLAHPERAGLSRQ